MYILSTDQKKDDPFAWSKALQENPGLFAGVENPDQESTVTISQKEYDILKKYENDAEGLVVEAYDENGNTFLKYVHIILRTPFGVEEDTLKRPVVSFGWPVEYYINDLARSFPFEKPLCIDAMGRNHRNSAVYVKADDVNKAFVKFIKYIEDIDIRDKIIAYIKNRFKARIKEAIAHSGIPEEHK